MQTTLSLEKSPAPRDRGRKGNDDDDEDETYPTQTANPQTLAITGVPADWVITKVVEP